MHVHSSARAVAPTSRGAAARVTAFTLLLLTAGGATAGAQVPGATAAPSSPAGAATAAPGDTAAAVVDSCGPQQQTMLTAFAAYGQKLQQAGDSAGTAAGPTPQVAGAGTVTWKQRYFDLPSVTMGSKRQELALNVPQVTMKVQKISFGVPTSRMVQKQVGCTPRMKVEGVRITTWCQPNYTNVPELYNRRVEFSTSVPEFAMRRQDFAYNIPTTTVTMRRVSLDLPSVSDGCIGINSDECKAAERYAKDRGGKMQTAFTAAQVQGATAVQPTIARYFGCVRSGVVASRKALNDSTMRATNVIRATLAAFDANGAEGAPEAVALRASLDTVVAAHAAAAAKFDSVLAELTREEVKVVEGLMPRESPGAPVPAGTTGSALAPAMRAGRD